MRRFGCCKNILNFSKFEPKILTVKDRNLTSIEPLFFLHSKTSPELSFICMKRNLFSLTSYSSQSKYRFPSKRHLGQSCGMKNKPSLYIYTHPSLVWVGAVCFPTFWDRPSMKGFCCFPEKVEI